MSNENKNSTSVSRANVVSTTSTASTPLPSVVDHTKKGSSNSVASNTKTPAIKAKSSANKGSENEKVTIPKADFDKLTQELTHWKNKCSQLSVKLDRIGGALIQVQGSVYNAKNSIFG